MSLFICIFFELGKIIAVRHLYAADAASASAASAKLAEQYDNCTDIEVWAQGTRVHAYKRSPTASG